MKPPALLTALCLVLMASIALAAPAERPNILFIIVNDQSPFDLKIYDPKSTLQTPVIDRLAAEGMVCHDRAGCTSKTGNCSRTHSRFRHFNKRHSIR